MNEYRIIIMLRSGILDNAGKAVTRALLGLGFESVSDVRIGKTITLECTNDDKINKIALSLVNVVMETFTVENLGEVGQKDHTILEGS